MNPGGGEVQQSLSPGFISQVFYTQVEDNRMLLKFLKARGLLFMTRPVQNNLMKSCS